MRFKSVSKSWNMLISDPAFVKLHLQHSPRNKHIAARTSYGDNAGCSVINFPLNRIVENPSIPIPTNPYTILEINDCRFIVGSCNGLLCLCGFSPTCELETIWFRIWNPATKTISKRLGTRPCKLTRLGYTFGYDYSTGTYKVIVVSPTELKILNLEDNSWRTFPPFDHVVTLGSSPKNTGVYLSGTVNWFAIRSNLSYHDWFASRNNITVDQFVIISLDLGTETYKQLSPPLGIDEVPYFEPIIVVLMDCLCFFHVFKKSHFVIWQMMEFGVEESWTQFLKISFQNLRDNNIIDWISFGTFPLCLSENGHTLILASSHQNQVILYNLRDNSIEQTSTNELPWHFAKDYVESLASFC